ncbi:hypothetical protein GN244_ATG09978 [Phytophthora infestans]|uniref:Uncharacterized protein n=1 Tax=Phytophthora infestans TaxID=4787 RepID=A0A833WUJ0_PHYIN|nr:hypothetical protein GN244_ATG09978 [Phytophthora infestans]
MSLETYHRLLLNPKSPWTKASGTRNMPIPVPLASNENSGDYQQKFEFWLAQRNVTLSSLREDVMRERNYRCGYARWRVQMKYGQSHPRSASTQQRSRSKSPERQCKRNEQERYQHSTSRPRSPERNSSYQGEPKSYNSSASTKSYNSSASATFKAGSSRFYDARHQVSKIYKGYRDQRLSSEDSCKNCDRKWDDLNRRIQKLESILSRLPRQNTFSGRNCSRYGGFSSSSGDLSPTFIDLTEDVDIETEAKPIRDLSQEGPDTTGDLDEPNADPGDDFELKSPTELTLLINAFNELNDDVLSKQKEEEIMVKDMELVSEEDKTNSDKLRSQIYELRDAIKRQKDKRDAAIVTIIVRTRTKTLAKLKEDLQKIATSGESDELEDLHEKCAGVAAKLAEKDKGLARLQKQLRSLSSLPLNAKESDSAVGKREARELSSKIRLEQASTASLKTERRKIIIRIMKSSRQIQALVTKEIARK